MLKSVNFNVINDTTVDCWYQYDKGATTSFDPAQVPAKLTEILGDLLGPLTAAKLEVEGKLAAAEAAKAEAEAAKAELEAELAALKAEPVAAEG